jgi:flagellin
VRKEIKMANIGATTAFYKVETSLTRANNEVAKSMERLATGKQNANAGDRSSYVAMSDTFRLDYVGTKAGIKSASVAMGYLETGMRVIDSASALLSRLQELAVLGSNNTNTNADSEAINLEAEAIADEFNRLMTTSTYKGKDLFTAAAANQEIAMGGRGQEMTFGIADVDYSSLWSTERTISGEPNNLESFNLVTLPSDAIVAKSYGANISDNVAEDGGATLDLEAGKKYVIRNAGDSFDTDMTDSTKDLNAASLLTHVLDSGVELQTATGSRVFTTLADGMVITVDSAADATLAASDTYGSIVTIDTIAGGGTAGTAQIYEDVTGTDAAGNSATFDIGINAAGAVQSVELVDGGSNFQVAGGITVASASVGNQGDVTFNVATINSDSVHYVEVNESATAFVQGHSYTIQSMGTSTGVINTATDDAAFISKAFTDASGNALTGTLKIGDTIKMATVGESIGGTRVTQQHVDAANALIQGMTFTRATETLTADIEAIQALFNKARVQAGSQYAALESAVSYTTDLTAQYELGFNTINDVNFSAETAHLAKNQILQQAATAMLAQANSGQQGLLQLIQG